VNDDYDIPAQATEQVLIVKKSRFIAQIFRTTSREQARACLQHTQAQYPDARHHCWASQIGSPSQPTWVAMSDDGEPVGTAGKPILNVIQHKLVGDVTVIVTRYFGGIKLGAGGLVRAYSQAVQQAYDTLTTHRHITLKRFVVSCAFSTEQSLRHWLAQHHGVLVDNTYRDQVELTVDLPPKAQTALERYCLATQSVLISR
jgi:uncharacterized YigZ family protein